MANFLWNVYALCYDAITGLAPYQEMLDEVVAALDLSPGMRVLDAGCGTGALADRLAAACPDIELLAVDLSPGMLARARTRRIWPSTFTFLEGNIDEVLANDARGFDRIVSVNVIWTLPDPGQTFARMAAGLRAHGRMVHTTPRWRFRANVVLWRHLRHRRGRDLLRALLGLPRLALAGLLNLVLVGQSVLRARSLHANQRWHADGLVQLLCAAGVPPRVVRPCYAGQGHLLVCDKESMAPTGPWLPAPAKDL